MESRVCLDGKPEIPHVRSRLIRTATYVVLRQAHDSISCVSIKIPWNDKIALAGRVVQLVRTSDLHSEGHRFESCSAHQNHRKYYKNSRFSNSNKKF